MTTARPGGEEDFTVDVRTKIRRDEYRYLFDLAERTPGVTVGALVAELVHRQLTVPARPQRRCMTADDHRRVRELNALGRNDTQIGRAIGFAPSTVSEYRRLVGLPKRSPAGRKPASRHDQSPQETP